MCEPEARLPPGKGPGRPSGFSHVPRFSGVVRRRPAPLARPGLVLLVGGAGTLVCGAGTLVCGAGTVEAGSPTGPVERPRRRDLEPGAWNAEGD